MSELITVPLIIFTAYVLIVSTIRWSIVELQHSFIHRELFKKSQRTGRLITEFFSTIFFTHALEDYRCTHLKHHNKNFTFTPEDDDFKLLIALGFRPGMLTQELKRHFYRCLISPHFHWRMLASRFSSNFGLGQSKTGIYRRLAAALWLGLLIYSAAFISLPAVLIGYVIPVLLMANIAALCQFSTEHSWGSASHQSWGRFVGEKLPTSIYGWFTWWLKLIFVWIPQRMMWLPGGLSSHDTHHEAGSRFDPFNPVYSRAALAQTGKYKLSETWGFNAALSRAMSGISKANSTTS